MRRVDITRAALERLSIKMAPPGDPIYSELGAMAVLKLPHAQPSHQEFPPDERGRDPSPCLPESPATFAADRCLGGNEVKSTDVLAIAEVWERWVTKGGQ